MWGLVELVEGVGLVEFVTGVGAVAFETGAGLVEFVTGVGAVAFATGVGAACGLFEYVGLVKLDPVEVTVVTVVTVVLPSRWFYILNVFPNTSKTPIKIILFIETKDMIIK